MTETVAESETVIRDRGRDRDRVRVRVRDRDRDRGRVRGRGRGRGIVLVMMIQAPHTPPPTQSNPAYMYYRNLLGEGGGTRALVADAAPETE